MQTGQMSRRRWLQSAAAWMGLALGLAAVATVSGGCGGDTDANTEGRDDVTKLELGCKGDELAFDQTALAAKAGATVELTFHNRSHHHQHNWVLVNGGDTEATAVYEAALAAGIKADWLPPAGAQVVVHTPLVASGESATITFAAPTMPGDYRYICTFPGHFLAGMKGTLTVS